MAVPAREAAAGATRTRRDRAAVPRVRFAKPSGTRRAPAWVLSILFFGAATYTVLFAFALTRSNTELLHALTIAPLLVGLTVPIALHIARSDGDRTLASIIMAGVVAKLLTALLRFYVAFEVYGNSDALQYHDTGLELVDRFRGGAFDPGIGAISGTNFIKIFTGLVYSVLGVSRITAFLVFAWIGFLGLVLMARAFRVGVPQGDSRRYLILVLFLPSLLYWPASIGKEAWMMLAIGLCAYGIANLLRGRSGGVAPLAVGLVGIGVVRPHIGLIVFVGFVLALLARRVRVRTFAGPLIRFAGLAALLVVGLVLAGETASFIGQPSLTAEVVTSQLDYHEGQTADGGSEFSPVAVNTPIDMVPAFVTVFIRPFPFEAANAQGLLSAAEGIFLVLLACASWKRIRAVPRLIRSSPYIAFCIGYVLVFVFAFASFSNFGLLARQRVQALPFLLVLFALPEFQTVPRRARTHPRREVPAPRGRPRRSRRPETTHASGIEPV